MALTIDDIATRVRLRSGESVTSPTRYFSDASIVAHVSYLAGMLEDELIGYNSPLLRATASITMSAASDSAALPSDFLAIADPWGLWKSGYADDPVEFNDGLRTLQIEEDASTSSDTTEWWTIDKDNLKVGPPVTSDTTWILEYYKSLGAFTTVSDSLPLGYKAQTFFAEGVLLMCENAREAKVDLETQLLGLVKAAVVRLIRKNRPYVVTM